jgi:hypothetical protein
MKSFGTILEKGKKRFVSKDNKGTWGRCEDCGRRKLLFVYTDLKNSVWNLCDECINKFAEEEIDETTK